MNTTKAFVRITAVNAFAWLPLALAGLAVLLRSGLGPNWRCAPWPLLAALAGLFLLRNHNAHHPWMAVCECGLGLILSLELLTAARPVTSRPLPWTHAGLATAFSILYVFAWVAFFTFHTREFGALCALISDRTPRQALIVIAEPLVSAGQPDTDTYEGVFDRKIISLDDWNQHAAEIRQSGKEIYLITHTAVPPGATFVGQSQVRPNWTDSIMVPLFDFYRTEISRRAPNDTPVFFDHYQLYKP